MVSSVGFATGVCVKGSIYGATGSYKYTCTGSTVGVTICTDDACATGCVTPNATTVPVGSCGGVQIGCGVGAAGSVTVSIAMLAAALFAAFVAMF